MEERILISTLGSCVAFRRSLLDSLDIAEIVDRIVDSLSKGNTGEICFHKKDETRVTRKVRLAQNLDEVPSGNNTTSHKPEIITLWDILGAKWIKVDITRLVYFKEGIK